VLEGELQESRETGVLWSFCNAHTAPLPTAIVPRSIEPSPMRMIAITLPLSSQERRRGAIDVKRGATLILDREALARRAGVR
jgi:hypothetical protein